MKNQSMIQSVIVGKQVEQKKKKKRSGSFGIKDRFFFYANLVL